MKLSKEGLDSIIELLAEGTIKHQAKVPINIAMNEAINYIHNTIDDYNIKNRLTRNYIYLVKQYNTGAKK